MKDAAGEVLAIFPSHHDQTASKGRLSGYYLNNTCRGLKICVIDPK